MGSITITNCAASRSRLSARRPPAFSLYKTSLSVTNLQLVAIESVHIRNGYNYTLPSDALICSTTVLANSEASAELFPPSSTSSLTLNRTSQAISSLKNLIHLTTFERHLQLEVNLRQIDRLSFLGAELIHGRRREQE